MTQKFKALCCIEFSKAMHVALHSVLSSLPSKSLHCNTCLQILFNPHVGTKFVASEDEQMLAFRSVLIQVGYSSRMFFAWG